MNKDNKKYAIVVSVMLAVGAIVAALPLLVEAAVNVSDGDTPVVYADITAGNDPTTVNATTTLTLTNSGDTVNGNKTDEVAGNKWVHVELPTDMTGFLMCYSSDCVQISGFHIYARIDSGTWHFVAHITSPGTGANMSFDITDSDWDYTWSSGHDMEIQFRAIIIDTDASDVAGTYSTATSGSDGSNNYPQWSIRGYS